MFREYFDAHWAKNFLSNVGTSKIIFFAYFFASNLPRTIVIKEMTILETEYYNSNSKVKRYIFVVSSILLWSCTFICYYFWYKASEILGWVPTHADIHDPASLKWPDYYYEFVNNSVIIGIISMSILIIQSVLGYFIKKNNINMKMKIVSFIGIIIFSSLFWGGFIPWWTD